MFKSHPLPCLQSSPSMMNLGTYPITSNAERIMDLWYDVHSFSISIFSQPLEDLFLQFLMSGGASGTIIGSLAGLAAVGGAINQSLVSASGTTRRKVVTAMPIAASDEQPFPKDRTTVCGEYPIHTFGALGAIVEINFGKTINIAGTFSPYIDISMSNGLSTSKGAFIVGGISFVGYGEIPIYGNQFSTVVGSIIVKERYSDLVMSTYTATENTEVTLQPKQGKTFTGFKDITEVYVGGQSASFQKSPDGKSLTLTVPKNARSGLITFLSKTSMTYNKFFSPDELKIIA